MNPINKLYLKVFLFTGIPFGVVMSFLDWLSNGSFSFWRLLFQVLFFGLGMSFSLVFTHKKELKKFGIQEFTDKNLSVTQSKTLSSNMNEAEFIDRLKNDSSLKMDIHKTENGLLLNSKMSWKSFGEKITVQINAKKDHEFEYQLTSQPIFNTVLVDYGKNLKNILYLEKILTL